MESPALTPSAVIAGLSEQHLHLSQALFRKSFQDLR